VIRLKGINRKFQVGDETVHALDDLSADIETGEYIAVMGPSGSGKSTLLNVLGLLDRPDSGIYSLDEINTSSLSEEARAAVRRNRIGFVFQSFHLVPRLSAAQNVELPLILAGVAVDERLQRVEQALESLGLSDRKHHRPDQLSGGQRQRVAIARATIMKPSILLADEPTGNLDKHSSEDVIRVLETLNEQGLTLIVVTHDPEIGERARRRMHMDDGRIVVGHAP
jgi:putative ABC transport system ATP-binding protein